MLALGIRYLNGFVAAAEPDNLERAEWPPHPARVFMALAAAYFQTGAAPDERAALLWLEGTERGGEISAPIIQAASFSQRRIVTHYVPVNDKAGPSKALLQSLPLTRDRQGRVFAQAWLEDEIVYICWPDIEPTEDYRNALSGLCSKVTRIGHSSSLVQMWLADNEEINQPNWVPDEERAQTHLRIPGPGTLDYLEQLYNAKAIEDYGELMIAKEQMDDSKLKKAARNQLRDKYGNQPPPQQRPQLSLYQGYAPPTQETATETRANTVFAPHFLVFQLRVKQSPYKQLDLASTLNITTRWRQAVISHSNGLSDPVRAVLSGHNEKGGPADDPHLAFLPLAFVDFEHADGHLLGMGLVLPDEISVDVRRNALRTIAAIGELRLGPLGVWMPEPVIASQPPWNLRAETWTAYPGGATHWATVTPVVFDRHPKAKNEAQYQEETAAMISGACSRIGLPQPSEVIVTQVSAHTGVPPSFAFPRLKRKDGSDRRQTHAILVFAEPVCGPIMIGAGRFRGYGVLKPMYSF